MGGPSRLFSHALGFGILEALIAALIFAYVQRTDAFILYGEIARSEKNKSKCKSIATA